MNLNAWTDGGRDRLRTRRLLTGYGLGIGAIVAVGAVLSLTSEGASAATKEDALEVTLANAPEPEPEPEVPEETVAKEVSKPPPRIPRVATPAAIPDAPPPEAEVKPSEQAQTLDPFAEETNVEKPAAEPPPPPPPPKVEEKKVLIAPKKPEGPVRVTEDMTPPKCRFHVDYPAALKAEGIEGVVIAKVTVTETGAVTDIKILKGPAEFREAVLLALQNATCTAALTADGSPVSVSKRFRIPFKIKVR